MIRMEGKRQPLSHDHCPESIFRDQATIFEILVIPAKAGIYEGYLSAGFPLTRE